MIFFLLYTILILSVLLIGWEGIIVVGAFIIKPIIKIFGFVLLIMIIGGFILLYDKHEKKVARGGYKTAEEMRIESEIAGQQAVDQFIKEQKEEKNKFGRLK